jgi:putative FmdB family regulatory protein
MPIYEYECKACGARSEALQKISADPLTDCPSCGAAALRRMVSAPVFRLKGSGWYETDFKTGNKKNLAGDDKRGGGADDKAPASGAAAAGGGDGASKTGSSATPASADSGSN